MKIIAKTWIAPAAILILTFYALPAFAADASGKWTCQDKSPDDPQSVNLTFVLKQEETKLTGTLTVTDGSGKILDSIKISNGKVDGDKITFVTVMSDDAKMTLKGTIHADEIPLTVVGGAESNEISELTLKRSK